MNIFIYNFFLFAAKISQLISLYIINNTAEFQMLYCKEILRLKRSNEIELTIVSSALQIYNLRKKVNQTDFEISINS